MTFEHAAIISCVLLAFIQNTAGMCNLSCTTDYYSSLNCSCPEQASASPFILMAECWNEFDLVNGSCEITPPQRWCQVKLEEFELVVTVDTNCSVAIGGEGKKSTNQVYFILHEHIKPEAPFNVQVTESHSIYNISWEMVYTDDENIHLNTHLFYRVRIRTTDNTYEKDASYFIKEDKRYLEISSDNLKAGMEYIADVQVTVNPTHFQASWSDWSPLKKWITKDEDSSPFSHTYGNKQNLFFLLLLLPGVLLFYFARTEWLKWHLCRYPSPEEFFKPLYHTYQGDFKKWVGPTFTLSEFDILEKNVVVHVVTEKRWPSLEKLYEGTSENNSHRDSREGKGPGSSSLFSLSSKGSSKHLLPRSSSQGKVHTAGHISIHTVTVSGEESTASGYPQGSFRSNFCAYLGDCEAEGLGHHSRSVLGEESQLFGASHPEGGPPLELNESAELYNVDWQLAAGALEAERLSLDSFCSNERSDDGYPQLELDLDTIDSGFLDSDCNSPVDTELTGKNPVLSKEESPHSNYIRQWVTYSPITGAQGNSTS